MRPRRPSLAVALGLALTLAAPHARAEAGEAEQRAAAQALFDAAVKLARDRRWDEACPKLEEVVRLQPAAVGAKLELAECYAQRGLLASAWSSYSAAESAAKAASQLARAQKAHERAQALRPRLSELTIMVPPDLRDLEGLEVRRDGVVIGPGQWQAPVPVDGGRHVITAKAAGRAPFQEHVDVPAERGRSAITVALAVPRVEGAAAPRPPSAPPPPAPAPSHGGVPTWPWVVGGVGAGLIVVGGAFGVDGLRASRTLQRDCGPELVCAADYDAMDSLTGRKNRGLALAIGLGGAGLVGVSAALVGIATAPRKAGRPPSGRVPEGTAASLRLAPAPLDRGAGLALGGSF